MSRRGRVFVQDVLAGTIEETDAGEYVFRYDPEYLAREGPPPVSLTFFTRSDGMLGLSPAYDLVATRMVIPEHSDREELALPVNGRKRKLTRKDFLAFGASLGILPVVIDRTLARFGRSTTRWQAHIDKSFLPPALQGEYRALLAGRLRRLGM